MITSSTRYICRDCAFKLTKSVQYAVNKRTHSSDRVFRPLRMAVIGSGPAGFYTTYRVMSKLPHALVDMYERLPVPFGLVRYGVAPDHPEVKNCEDKFEEVASSPNFRFIGNAEVGDQIPFQLLQRNYDCILLAYGSSKDKLLGIPGETSTRGIYSAGALVGWYNGHPDFQDLDLDLTAGEEAVVIGQGNVALDVARILLTKVDDLRKTDIAESALEKLAHSAIRRVTIVGRRGPMQASFTVKEVREIRNLLGVRFDQIDDELFPPDITKLPRASKRLMQVLQSGIDPLVPALRSVSLRFMLSPVKFTSSNDHVTGVQCEINRYSELPFDRSAKVEGTSQTTTIPASLVLRSIGYRSEPLQGLSSLGATFNTARGTVSNHNGRVFNAETHNSSAVPQPVPGVYASGWVKKGPTGVIATTMYDAFDTADAMVDDWERGLPFLQGTDPNMPAGYDGVQSGISSTLITMNWDDWHRIDEVEKARGRSRGKETREKLTSISAMLDAAHINSKSKQSSVYPT